MSRPTKGPPNVSVLQPVAPIARLEGEFVTADELAAILKIPRKSIYGLPIRRQPIGRRVRYAVAEVRAFLALQEQRQRASRFRENGR